MFSSILRSKPLAFGAAMATAILASCAFASDLLVADRLTNSVYRYSETGAFLGVILSDNVNINQPVGMALSPDLKKLYISSAQNSRLISYDYDYAGGTAHNPTILAEGRDDGLAFPNAILVEPDGSKIYVSNLDPTQVGDIYVSTGVAQFYSNGTSAGPNINGSIGGGSIVQLSGLAWGPDGKMLVGGFLDFPSGSKGAVGKSNEAKTTLGDFLGPSASLYGASSVMVHGNDVYVSGMFASNIRRYNYDTGALDSAFDIEGLAFPQGLVLSPDGNGFLAGILGFANGQGRIAHYDFDGHLVGDGVFADPGGGGFTEATVMVVEPGLPGDFNADRIVDASDLAIWKMNFGNHSGTATNAMGDADGNGVVDGNDFVVLQRRLTSSSSSAMTVPEPQHMGSMAAIAVAILALGMGERRIAWAAN
jgi:hypothetical protein